MTKQICILDIRETVAGFVTVRCCFWFAITAEYPAPNFVSSYLNVDSDPNTAGITSALRAGTLIEETYNLMFPTSAVDSLWTTVEAIILAYYNARVAFRSGSGSVLPDPGAKLGVLHDSSTGWSA